MNTLSLFLLLFIFLSTFYFFKKINILNENTNYSVHKNFGKSNKSPLIIGGIFFSIIVSFFFSNELIILKLSLGLIFILGLLSDKNILPSPKIRLIIQVFILFFLVFYSELRIENLENNYLNNLLKNNLVNIFFTIFCLAILINGSNFIDGLNGLLSGYFLLIFFSIFYISFFNDQIAFIHENEIKIIFSSLLIFFVFNILGKVYLGDSGSYLLATFIGFYLVDFVYNNLHIHISPYYVASILWYPAFENFFSISRRVLQKNNISSPDNKHLHQMIFLFLKSKKIFKSKNLNTTSSIFILLFNTPTFIISSLMATHSQILVFIILLNLSIYLLFYYFISKKLEINK